MKTHRNACVGCVCRRLPRGTTGRRRRNGKNRMDRRKILWKDRPRPASRGRRAAKPGGPHRGQSGQDAVEDAAEPEASPGTRRRAGPRRAAA